MNRNSVLPRILVFFSCFFGPAMPYLFQTVLSPLYGYDDLSRRAGTFQILPLEKGTAGFGEQVGGLWQTAPIRSVTQREPRHSQRHQLLWKWEISVHFPFHGAGNCSVSRYLVPVKPADKTTRYHFSC